MGKKEIDAARRKAVARASAPLQQPKPHKLSFDLDDLLHFKQKGDLRYPLCEEDKETIIAVLKERNGYIEQAARVLGTSGRTLTKLAALYGITPEDYQTLRGRKRVRVRRLYDKR